MSENKKVLLKEYFSLCPDGICNITLLTEQEKMMRQNGDMLLTGVIQVADQKNGNGRIYSKKVLERELENYQKVIRERRATGCLDHTDSSVIELQNASHLMLRAWFEGDNMMGVLKVLNTPCGKTLRSLVDDGVQVGISSRALGSLSEGPRGAIVNDDLTIICWDIVSDSSVSSAYLHLMENQNYRIEITKADRIYRALNEVLRKK